MPTDAPYYLGSRLRPERPGAPPRSRATVQPQQPTYAPAAARRRAPHPRAVRFAVLDAERRRRAARHGFEVTILRLPGHGTLPSGMVHMQYEDWVAAMHVAARDISARLPKNLPFYIAGYSTGGTLSLTYALDAIRLAPTRRCGCRHGSCSSLRRSNSLRRGATPILDLFAKVPIRAFEKVNWQSIGPEYDPYKFVSFPVNATRQVYNATQHLRRSCSRPNRPAALPDFRRSSRSSRRSTPPLARMAWPPRSSAG